MKISRVVPVCVVVFSVLAMGLWSCQSKVADVAGRPEPEAVESPPVGEAQVPLAQQVEVPQQETQARVARTDGIKEHSILHRGQRPRFSPDGRFLAFEHGDEGQRQIFVWDQESGTVRQVAALPGDNRDPAWIRDSKRLVFSSNQHGKYDLFVIGLDGIGLEQITDLPGDALQPTASALQFSFFVVENDGCGSGGDGALIDAYDKIAFTRRYGKPMAEEIWFTSFRDAEHKNRELQFDRKYSEAMTHQGRISAEGAQCSQPTFSGDGLSLAWSCDDGGQRVHDARAHWDQRFEDALKAIGHTSIDECQKYTEGYDFENCLAKLPRRYSRYPMSPLSQAGDGLARPAYSANHTLMLADGEGGLRYRERFHVDATWQPLEVDARAARNLVWSPDGKRVAFDLFDPEKGNGQERFVAVADTEFYLQEVHNLHQFEELFGIENRSERLDRNRFVVRPGKEREFYALYEKLRYRRRPQFITADAVLQLFRDEFLRILEKAEEQASQNLQKLSKSLTDHYVARYKETDDPRDEYLAVYFAVPTVFLQAAAAVAEEVAIDPWDLIAAQHDDDQKIPTREAIMPRMPNVSQKALKNLLPDTMGQKAWELMEQAFAHQGLGKLAVPSKKEPATVDWSQFLVRGNYAESSLAGYFLAMSWYAQAPLPFDGSLAGLVRAMQTVQIDGQPALALWNRIDTLVGSFMGKPVDASISHLIQVHQEQAAIFEPFQTNPVRKALEDLRGPISIRDVDSLMENVGGERILKVTFFPKRVGLDTTFFSKLTYPHAGPRPFPSALDVMAVLGSTNAYRYVTASQDELWARQYGLALDGLIEEHRSPGEKGDLRSTDIYHSWLALLSTLATAHQVDDRSLMDFARTDAWRDRLLFSGLAGYTQLKHVAVLYNAQDTGIECGGEPVHYALVEQPVLPTPHGFVDPLPTFFDGLATLAGTVYETLYGDAEGPLVRMYHPQGFVEGTVRTLALELATIARHQAAGEAPSEEQLKWLEFVGVLLEGITVNLDSNDLIQIPGDGRVQRGIVLATDIHTNIDRHEVLQIGVGTIMDLYVVVPVGAGQTMTQGGIFSFYEFIHPMGDRLTDDKWF